MRKKTEICAFACCLCIFLAACSVEHDNNGEAESTSNEEVGEAREMLFENDDTERVSEAGEYDFDIENTIRVLEELLEHPVTEGGDVIGAMRDAGIRGAIRAEWTEPPEPPRSVVPSFIIESEDNRIYCLHGNFCPMSGHFMVNVIRDMETGETIYAIYCGGE